MYNEKMKKKKKKKKETTRLRIVNLQITRSIIAYCISVELHC